MLPLGRRAAVTCLLACASCAATVACSIATDTSGLTGSAARAPDASDATEGDARETSVVADATIDASDARTIHPNLVGEWRFDETPGNLVLDTSGHEHHGRLTGTTAVEPSDGGAGGVLRLTGDGYLVIDSLEGASFPASAGTLVFSMRSEIDEGDTAMRALFDDWDSTREHLYVRHESGITYQLALMGPGDTYAFFVKTDIPRATWKRIAFTWDSESAHGAIYFDGRTESEYDFAHASSAADQYMRFGGGFVGTLDDVQLYDHALTALEIANLTP